MTEYDRIFLLTSETYLVVFGDLSFTHDPGLLDEDLSPDDIGRPPGCKLDDCSENIDLGLLSDDWKREGRFLTFSDLIIRNSRLGIFFLKAIHKVIVREMSVLEIIILGGVSIYMFSHKITVSSDKIGFSLRMKPVKILETATQYEKSC